ncbi:MAG: GDSL-type esterase/lipase family protein [Clostridiales bacterium]|nr:GDSL-type esterase/lipase family protein [Clostridiales bacterium]
MKKHLICGKAAMAGILSAALLAGTAFPSVAGMASRSLTTETEAAEAETESAETTETEAETTESVETSETKVETTESAGTTETEAETTGSEETSETEAETSADGEISESDIEAFFSNTVMTGDSVMVGFRNYCMRSSDPLLKSLSFLASGSFSVHNALWPVSSKSVHPVFQGAQRPVWESISMLQAEKVFMFFGLNDMNMGTDTCERYQDVIANIRQLSPDIQIYIISMTYTLNGRGKGRLNNDNISVFNAQMKQLAEDNVWGFIDMATPLAEGTGNLAPQYCSDNYVHQTNAAYQVWTEVLRQYAREQLMAAALEEETASEETLEEESTEAEETSGETETSRVIEASRS